MLVIRPLLVPLTPQSTNFPPKGPPTPAVIPDFLVPGAEKAPARWYQPFLLNSLQCSFPTWYFVQNTIEHINRLWSATSVDPIVPSHPF